MHPRIAELRQHLADTRRNLLRAIEEVPEEGRHRAPDGRWSVAQVVEHLAVVEERSTGRLEQLVAKARAESPGHDTDDASILGAMPVERALDRSTPLQAPAVLHPAEAPDLAASVARLETVRARLLALLSEADGLRLDQVHAPHPAFGSLTAYQWFAMIGLHEARHTQQVREAGSATAP